MTNSINIRDRFQRNAEFVRNWIDQRPTVKLLTIATITGVGHYLTDSQPDAVDSLEWATAAVVGAIAHSALSRPSWREENTSPPSPDEPT